MTSETSANLESGNLSMACTGTESRCVIGRGLAVTVDAEVRFVTGSARLAVLYRKATVR